MLKRTLATLTLVVIFFGLFDMILIPVDVAFAVELYSTDFENGDTLVDSGFINIIDCENQSGDGLGGSTWGMRGRAALSASAKYYCEATAIVSPTGREFSVEADFDHVDAVHNRFGYTGLGLGYSPDGFTNLILDLYHGVGAANPDRDLLELYMSEEDDFLVWTSDPGVITPGTTQNIRMEGVVSTIANWDVQPDGEVRVFVDDVEVVHLTNKKIGYNWDTENGVSQWNRVVIGPMGRLDNLSISDGFGAGGPQLPSPTATITPSPSRMLLNWTAVTDAESYEIQMCDGVGCTDYESYGTFTTDFENLTNGVPGTLYRFRIRAIDTDGLIATSDWYEFEGTPNAGLPAEAEFYEFNAGTVVRFTPSTGIAGAPSQTTFVLYGPTTSSGPSIAEWIRLTAANDLGSPTGSELSGWQASGTYPTRQGAGVGPGESYAYYNWRLSYDPTQLAGDRVFRGLAPPYDSFEHLFYTEYGNTQYATPHPGYGIFPEWTAEINGRSATYDPVTNNYLGDGELRVDLTSTEVSGQVNMVNLSGLDWKWHPDNRRFRVGWGISGELYEIWFSARRVLPTGPEDPYLVAYHDFNNAFTPADSIYDGLVYYDPTFDRVGGVDYTSYTLPVNSGAIIGSTGSAFSAYEGVGIDFSYPVDPGTPTPTPTPTSTPTPTPGGVEGGGANQPGVTPIPTSPIGPPNSSMPNNPQITITETGLPRTGIYLSFIPGVWFMYIVFKIGEAHWMRVKEDQSSIKMVSINFTRFEYSFD